MSKKKASFRPNLRGAIGSDGGDDAEMIAVRVTNNDPGNVAFGHPPDDACPEGNGPLGDRLGVVGIEVDVTPSDRRHGRFGPLKGEIWPSAGWVAQTQVFAEKRSRNVPGERRPELGEPLGVWSVENDVARPQKRRCFHTSFDPIIHEEPASETR